MSSTDRVETKLRPMPIVWKLTMAILVACLIASIVIATIRLSSL